MGIDISFFKSQKEAEKKRADVLKNEDVLASHHRMGEDGE